MTIVSRPKLGGSALRVRPLRGADGTDCAAGIHQPRIVNPSDVSTVTFSYRQPYLVPGSSRGTTLGRYVSATAIKYGKAIRTSTVARTRNGSDSTSLRPTCAQPPSPLMRSQIRRSDAIRR